VCVGCCGGKIMFFSSFVSIGMGKMLGKSRVS
jgi:hypothetical protein